MKMIDALLRLQVQQHRARCGMFPELEEYLSNMRGQALPQSAPAEVSAAIREAMRMAASEERQLLLSNLPLDVTAVRIDRFFAGFDVESIAIAYDSITEMPVGTAHVDMKTSEDAEAALDRLSGKSMMGRRVDVKLKIHVESENLAQPADFQVHSMQAQNTDDHMADSIAMDALPAAEVVDGGAAADGFSHLTEGIPRGIAETAELVNVLDDSPSRSANSAIPRAKRKHVKGSQSKRFGFYLEMVNEERTALQLGNLAQTLGPGKRRNVFICDPDTDRRTKVDGDFRPKVNKRLRGSEKERREARALAAAEAHQVCRALGLPAVATISTPDDVAENQDEVAGNGKQRKQGGRRWGAAKKAKRDDEIIAHIAEQMGVWVYG